MRERETEKREREHRVIDGERSVPRGMGEHHKHQRDTVQITTTK